MNIKNFKTVFQAIVHYNMFISSKHVAETLLFRRIVYTVTDEPPHMHTYISQDSQQCHSLNQKQIVFQVHHNMFISSNHLAKSLAFRRIMYIIKKDLLHTYVQSSYIQ